MDNLISLYEDDPFYTDTSCPVVEVPEHDNLVSLYVQPEHEPVTSETIPF